MKRILALILLLSLFASLLVGCKKDNSDGNDPEQDDNNDPLVYVDLMKDDLSPYVEVDEKYYKGLSITLDPDRLHPFYIESYIIEQLRAHKSKEPVEGDGVISVGDVVSIFYKGYYLDGEGKKVYFEGGSNHGRSSHDLEIGSGGFIPGFEYNMIGKVVSEYSKESPMIVEAYFPHNYQAKEIAGKVAYFEVYVEIKDGKYQIKEYDAPEFTEEFITETLDISEEELSGYEGDTLIERYRSMAREILIVKTGLDADTLATEAFWNSVLEGAVITDYPSGNLKEIFDEVLAEVEAYYRSNPNYAYYYPTLELFTCVYFGIEEGGDWQSEVNAVAKSHLKPLFILYRVAAKEGFIPTEQEHADETIKYLADELAKSNITRENYESDEKFLEALDTYKKYLVSKFGEDAFEDMIDQKIIMRRIIALVEVVKG